MNEKGCCKMDAEASVEQQLFLFYICIGIPAERNIKDVKGIC